MTLPYTFATATGNIPLSELDVNFANVQAYVFTAGQVTNNAQPNITSVGNLSSLTINDLTTTNDINVTGQLTINWLDGNAAPLPGPGILASTANIYDIGQSTTKFRSGYFSGNVYAGNIINSGSSSITGNISGGNIIATGIVTATGNLYIGNIINSGSSSVAGNVTSGNIITPGTIKNTGLEVVAPNYINITANAQTASLSSATSTNFIIANNTGYTCTVNLPSSPVDGQITRFTVAGNTVTLATGTGNVNSSFAGSTTVGTGFKYIYRVSANTWFKSI